MNHVEEFRSAMKSCGLDYSGPINQDGKRHRVKCDGDHNPDTWYILHPANPIAAGIFGCWKRGIKQTWKQNGGEPLSSQDYAALKQKWAKEQAEADKEQQDLWERTSKECQKEISGCKPAGFSNDYLRSKSVAAYGGLLENEGGELLLPLQDGAGRVWSYQTIDCLGDKLFRMNGKVQGCYFSLCDRKDGPLVVCEGYATGATIHQATGWATACAMNCGNMESVAKALREINPGRPMVIAADNDRFTRNHKSEPYNPGVEKGKKAALASKAKLVIPEFPLDSTNGTDFNDLAVQCGMDAVLNQLSKAMPSPLSILSLEEIALIPTSNNDRILGDHLLDRGSAMTIVGSGGVGKTRMVYQFLSDCYSGKEKFFTLDIHPAARNMRWLVLQCENSPIRLKDTRSALKASMSPLAYLKLESLVRVLTPITELDTMLNLDSPEVVSRIQQSLDSWMPDGIIFDSLYDFGIGDLNKDVDMRKTVTAISRVGRHRNPNRAIIVLHHSLTGKDSGAKAVGADRASFGRNSKVLFNWSRAQINMSAISEENNDHLAISCGKCSNGREFTSFAVKLDQQSLTYLIDSETNVSEWAKSRQSTTKPTLITSDQVANLCREGIKRTELVHALMEETGCKRENSYRYIRRAFDEGKIRESSGFIFRNKNESEI